MKTPLNLSDTEIENILDEVQGVLAAVTKSEKDKATRLAKGEDDEGPKEESGGGPPPAAESSAPPAAEASAPPAGPSPGADAGPPPGAAAGGDPAALDGPVDPAALLAEYSKLPLDQLKMHAEVAMQALQSAMGGGMGGDPSMGAGGPPPPGAGAPPPAAGPPGADPMAGGPPPPMGKKEYAGDQNNGGEMKAAKKAEQQITDLKKSLADQEAVTSKLAEAFTKFVSKPMRKAEVALPNGKPADVKLAKSEVKAKLTAKIQDRSLTKSDRELINRVLFDQPVDDAAIAHLLKV